MELHTIAALLLSGLIGVSLGLLGGGGSILAVPVLVYVGGVEVKEAVAMSLAIVGATSLFASVMHRQAGNLDLKVAAVFGGAGVFGAFFGAKLTHLVSSAALLLMFALLMLVVGTLMFTRSEREERVEESPVDKDNGKTWQVLAAALSVGVLTGFLGVGGGFLIVPALVLFSKLPMKLAVGTSLLVIAINSAAGFLGHLGQGDLNLRLTLAFTAVAIVGALLGERVARRIAASSLQRAFAVFVVITGIFLLVKNVGALSF